MNNTFESFRSLSEVKSTIRSLDTEIDSALYLEHLMRNAFEILMVNDESYSALAHTYHNKEMADLLESQINVKRTELFKKVQLWCSTEISSKELSIDSIPEEWRMPRVKRLSTS